MKKTLFAAILATTLSASGQNPYLPLWEYIPDGEPYVFEDPDKPGSYRVYVYGSHDNLKTAYCGRDQVVWSAPIDDLTQWRYDGVILTVDKGAAGQQLAEVPDVLYAPDVVEIVQGDKKIYYLTPNDQVWGRRSLIARADRPDGPFEVCNWNADGQTTYGVFDFDPAIFCDDDGRVYGYWGFGNAYAVELDPSTMCTPKDGMEPIVDFINGYQQDGVFRFFEASSMRKIMGKYVFIYSRVSEDGEWNLPASNYTLAYAYGDSPLGPFVYGGTLIDGRARGLDQNGNTIVTACADGNTHGSLCQVGDQWYVFYHRQAGTDQYSRQAMVAPVEVCLDGDRLVITEGEYNSEGFALEGLDPLERHSAGVACYYTGPQPMTFQFPKFFFTGSYVDARRPEDNMLNASYSLNQYFCPVVNNTAGSIVGYKYFNFDKLVEKENPVLLLGLKPEGHQGTIKVMIDSPWAKLGGIEIGKYEFPVHKADKKIEAEVPLTNLSHYQGKHALYLIFESSTQGKSLCELYTLMFR